MSTADARVTLVFFSGGDGGSLTSKRALVGLPTSALAGLGELVALGYRRRGERSTRVLDAFFAPLPLLACTLQSRRLIIAGGRYSLALPPGQPLAGAPSRMVGPRGHGAFSARELAEARSFYRALHWGLPARRVLTLDCADPSEHLRELGTLVSITYRTTKLGDGGEADYVHEFEADRPILALSHSSRRLVIAGGSYSVGIRGIIG